MKYVSIDIETCGLDPVNSSILEAAFVIEDTNKNTPIENLPYFHIYFLPENGKFYKGEPYALSMHSEIFKRIAKLDPAYSYSYPINFGELFAQFLSKNDFREMELGKIAINVAGKNFGSFDLQFFNNQTDLNKYVKIRSRIIDPAILFLQPEDNVLPGLDLCKQRAGLNNKVSHNALDDARDIISIIRESKMFNKEIGTFETNINP